MSKELRVLFITLGKGAKSRALFLVSLRMRKLHRSVAATILPHRSLIALPLAAGQRASLAVSDPGQGHHGPLAAPTIVAGGFSSDQPSHGFARSWRGLNVPVQWRAVAGDDSPARAVTMSNPRVSERPCEGLPVEGACNLCFDADNGYVAQITKRRRAQVIDLLDLHQARSV